MSGNFEREAIEAYERFGHSLVKKAIAAFLKRERKPPSLFSSSLSGHRRANLGESRCDACGIGARRIWREQHLPSGGGPVEFGNPRRGRYSWGRRRSFLNCETFFQESAMRTVIKKSIIARLAQVYWARA